MSDSGCPLQPSELIERNTLTIGLYCSEIGFSLRHPATNELPKMTAVAECLGKMRTTG